MACGDGEEHVTDDTRPDSGVELRGSDRPSLGLETEESTNATVIQSRGEGKRETGI